MPQPIDLQTEIGRTMAAERIQDASARATMLAAQRAQSEEDKVRLTQQAQVGQTPQTDSREVDEKGKEGEGRERGRKRKPVGASGQTPASPRKALEPGGEHGFDVSV
mgnify:CR=1 FL=1